MFRRSRHRLRQTASALTVVLCVTLAVTTCTVSAQMTIEEKACCAAMHHDCGEMAVTSTCCTGESRDAESIAATKPAVTLVPATVLVAVLDTPIVSAAVPHWLPASIEPSSVGPPGTPTYLFVSSFRI